VSTARALDDGSWEAILVGLPAEREGWLEVIQEGAVVESATVTTGAIDSRIPVPDVITGESEGYFLTSVLGDSVYYPVIFDGEGNLVWWHVFDGEREWYTSRLWLSADGSRFYYNIYNIDPDEPDSFSGVVSLRPDGSDIELISLPNNHHDFWLHDDGAIAYPHYNTREIEGVKVIGDELVRWNPDGSEDILWSSWETLNQDRIGSSDNPNGIFWTMANSLEYSESTASYVLGLRNQNSLIQIMEDGGLGWTLGGPVSDFSVEEPFSFQHNFELTGDEILLFDNNSDDRESESSRLMRIRLDEKTSTSDLEWVFIPTPGLYTAYFGDVVNFPGGIASSWGTGGLIRVNSDGGPDLFSIEYTSPVSVAFLRWEEALVK
jgi:hypothetical protein